MKTLFLFLTGLLISSIALGQTPDSLRHKRLNVSPDVLGKRHHRASLPRRAMLDNMPIVRRNGGYQMRYAKPDSSVNYTILFKSKPVFPKDSIFRR